MSHPSDDKIWQQMKSTGLLGSSPVVFMETTASTNAVAMELARKDAVAGTIVVAETQTAGRGRLSRTWISPQGAGLYFSLILRPNLALNDLPKITIAAGVAVCRALERETSVAPKIKWPNDILIDGRKCGGILTEANYLTSSDSPLVVLGIGLNITTSLSDFPEELRTKVTSLAEASGHSYRRGTLLQAILSAIDEELALLESGAFQKILTAWRNRDAIGTARLRWITTAGTAVTGTSLGLDNHGVLHIRDDKGGIHQVISGDINLLK